MFLSRKTPSPAIAPPSLISGRANLGVVPRFARPEIKDGGGNSWTGSFPRQKHRLPPASRLMPELLELLKPAVLAHMVQLRHIRKNADNLKLL